MAHFILRYSCLIRMELDIGNVPEATTIAGFHWSKHGIWSLLMSYANKAWSVLLTLLGVFEMSVTSARMG